MNERGTEISKHVAEEILFNFRQLSEPVLIEILSHSPAIDSSKLKVNFFRMHGASQGQSPLTLLTALSLLYVEGGCSRRAMEAALGVSQSISTDPDFTEAMEAYHPMSAIFLNTCMAKDGTRENMRHLFDSLVAHGQCPEVLNIKDSHLIETMMKHYFSHWGFNDADGGNGLHQFQFELLRHHYGDDVLKKMVNKPFTDFFGSTGAIGSPLALILHRFYKLDRGNFKKNGALEFAVCLVKAGANVDEKGFSGKPILDDIPLDRTGKVKNALLLARNEFLSRDASLALRDEPESALALKRRL